MRIGVVKGWAQKRLCFFPEAEGDISSPHQSDRAHVSLLIAFRRQPAFPTLHMKILAAAFLFWIISPFSSQAYVTLNADTNTLTCLSGVTYYVTAPVNVTTLILQGGTIIKFAPGVG